MPFKEEDINNEPLIKIYHDVLYEEEILKIKTMASENVSNIVGLNIVNLVLLYIYV